MLLYHSDIYILFSLRNDTFYSYDEEVDIITIDFAKESAGYNHSEETIEHKVLVSYDNDEKIVSVDILKHQKICPVAYMILRLK